MNIIKTAAAGLALAVTMGTAHAVPATFDLAGNGIYSCDGPGAPCNISVTFDLGTFLGSPGSDVNLNQVDWDVTIETVGASWLSEAVISFQWDANDGSGFIEQATLTAGAGDGFPGTMNYQGSADTSFLPTISGGIMTLEFYESFDDVSDEIDAFYIEPSTLTFDIELAVSEPAVLALLGLGLVGLAATRRRRS